MVENATERKNNRVPDPDHHPEPGSPQSCSQEMAGNPEYTNIQIVVTADGYFFTRIFTAVPLAMSEKRSDYHGG
jgi:hypothetical protein